SLQEPGEPPVGEELPAGLAGRAVLQGRVTEGDLAHGVPAHWAWQAGPAVDSHPDLLLRLELACGESMRALDGRTESVGDGRIERFTLLGDQFAAGLNGESLAACRTSSEYAFPMPAITDWSRRTPLIWARPAASSSPSKTCSVKEGSSGSGPSRAMPGTSF